jgi:hypothetical protein
MSQHELILRIGYHPEILGGIVQQTAHGLGAYFWHVDSPEQPILVPQDLSRPIEVPDWVYERIDTLRQFSRMILYVERHK